MATKHKFKVGDKVRILKSALDINVGKEDIGKTGVVKYCRGEKDIDVFMDEVYAVFNFRVTWGVHSSMIELVVEVGQQLLFAFMSEQEEE